MDLAADIDPGDLPAQAGALAGLMVGRYRYVGDSETYDDLDNANLIRVIQRRRGLPVAIGILWLHAARAAGWRMRGVNFPGHFIVALEADQDGKTALVAMDVFAGGQTLDHEDLRSLVKRVYGEKAELGPAMLAPMTTRDVLLRLQTNIKARLLSIGQLQAANACLADMLRLAPSQALLWWEAALLHHRQDEVAGALRCYTRFLELAPAGETATRARSAVVELRGRLN